MITFSKIGQLGQLGNQMFQYAMLLGVAAKHGYDIGIPLELAEAKSRTGPFGKGRLALFDAFTGITATDSAGSTPLFRLTETRHEFVPEVVDAQTALTSRATFKPSGTSATALMMCETHSGFTLKLLTPPQSNSRHAVRVSVCTSGVATIKRSRISSRS